ncbi:hypothetical protein L7F22_020935 [Adiantum nelumboides]|nr:hypothetical protein [Adiantum nelumboides]
MGPAKDELETLRLAMVEKQAAIEKQGGLVRALKASKASQTEIEAAINDLQTLKLEFQTASKDFAALSGVSNGSVNSEAFRKEVNKTLQSRLFIIPSFQIYGGVAGLYDYGPPGCAVKANVLGFWRQHFVLEEGMLEVDCPCVTPHAVLKASGHVDKFTDLMVKDEKSGLCYRADHLLKEFCKENLEKDLLMSTEKRDELRHVLAVLDELTADELGAKIKQYGIVAPDTKNVLSDPYPFNLMFSTSIGPTGLLQGYLRPETAQGIFVNFKDLYYFNGTKLPFAAAQIGQAFRNEIAPRQGLLRVREFTLAEIEHFVNPDDKSHPKFKDVADLELLLFPRDRQMRVEDPVLTRLGDAVAKGVINNETLGYFIGRTYLFLVTLGIDKDRLRFRQHLLNEMAHYAADCWDAEIECSYGWIECVGLADRSAYDLKAHTEKSKVDLVAREKFTEPREVENLVIMPIKKETGRFFKEDARKVEDSLKAMTEAEAMGMKERLDKEGQVSFKVCTLNREVNITKNMVSISKTVEKVTGRTYTPSVIEPSFGIGRIIYCLYEHSFYTRPSKTGEEDCNVFRFSPVVAPIKCTVFPLVQKKEYDDTAIELSKQLTRAGLSCKIDTTGTSIGKRYARTDELGVPFAVTVDSVETVTVRERDSKEQIRIPVKQVPSVLRDLCDRQLSWTEAMTRFEVVGSSTDNSSVAEDNS